MGLRGHQRVPIRDSLTLNWVARPEIEAATRLSPPVVVSEAARQQETHTASELTREVAAVDERCTSFLH